MTDTEWALIAPLLPEPSRAGRPWRWPLRAILDGIQYVLRTGCAWRHLPLDFPPWSTVHRWFLRLSKAGVFERLAHALTMADRERTEREASPRRWVIERTFGWIARCRRLARDYEATPSSALAFFVLAAAMILVRRLAKPL